jgi:hypothetical protein
MSGTAAMRATAAIMPPTKSQSPGVAGCGCAAWRSSSAKFFVFDFQNTSATSPNTGITPAMRSIATFMTIRSCTTRGTPR